MDISAAIEKIESLATRAAGNELFTFVPDTGRFRITNSMTGEIKWVKPPELPPIVQVNSLEDLYLACHQFGIPEETVVWVSERQVVLVFDVSRVGRAIMPLVEHPAFALLQKLENLEPQVLKRMIRVGLFGTDLDPVDFESIISNLKFESTQTSDMKVMKGDESISKSVRAKVTGENEIPEALSVTFSAYPSVKTVSSKVTVNCAVITDPTAGTVSVVPFPGEIKSCIQEAMEDVMESLREMNAQWVVIGGNCPT